MTRQPISVQVREAHPEDLTALYPLARNALTHDTFSMELLAEKLFRIPRPGRQVGRVFLAEVSQTPVGMMQALWQPADARGWLGLFAVQTDCRRRGIATALLENVRRAWQAAGVRAGEVLAIPGNYFTPGIDPRYTEGLCFLERSGFERFKDCVNLTASLEEPFETTVDEQRLAEEDVLIRRARSDDGPLLDVFFEQHFGADWRLEAQLALDNDPPTLHVGLRDSVMVAFSAHSTQNREWGFFGPMGTAPAARGLGIARVLLWHCLNDLRQAGHRTAVIPWVGPVAFYARHANCRVERVFWRYRCTINETSTGPA